MTRTKSRYPSAGYVRSNTETEPAKPWSLIIAPATYGATDLKVSAKNASDIDAVKSTMADFYTALSSRKMNKMGAIWAHVPYASLLNPRDKSAAVGWTEISRRWQDTFNNWNDLKVIPKQLPEVHVKGRTAWSHSEGLGKISERTDKKPSS